jgi:recombination protein RecA
MGSLDALKEAVGDTEKTKKDTAEKTKEKPVSLKDKLSLLRDIEKNINKEYDVTNSIIRLGDRVGKPTPHIPTGILSLDREVIGIGGIPRGSIVEVYGPESSGKSTLAAIIAAQEQMTGSLVAYIDMEHALDPNYMSKLGVDVANLIVAQPDSGEQALDTAEYLVESGIVTLIIIDSVAALVPLAELNGDMGDSFMGLQARLMSQACRKLVGKCKKNDVTIIFINQIREKIGVMFGSPETTTGGRALKFFASLRLDIRKIGTTKEGETVTGHKVRIKSVKSRVDSPFRETEVDLVYGQGFDSVGDLLDMAVKYGVIEQKGSFYKLEGESMGQGRANASNALKTNLELYNKVFHNTVKCLEAVDSKEEKSS